MGMGELLKRKLRADPADKSETQIEDVAEGALMMQEQLARDVLSLAEESGVRKSDKRVKRAKEIFEKLR
jgi:hypothetical protein